MNNSIKKYWQKILLKKMLKHDVPAIQPKAAYALKDKIIFLDSREKAEYDVSHLPNAVYAGFKNFKIELLEHIDKKESVIVYCSVGLRSEKITRALMHAGYTNVYNMYGGIFEWVNNGYTIVDAKQLITTKIHVFNKRFGSWVYKGEKVYS